MTAKSKAFDAETVTSVMTFILNYAEQFGHLFLTMPNSSDLYHQEGFQHSTMLTWWSFHVSRARPASTGIIRRLSSNPIWRLFLKPIFEKFGTTSFLIIAVQKPRTDLCAQCRANFTSLGQQCTLDDEAKQTLVKKSADHLADVTRQRSLYQNALQVQAYLFMCAAV